MHAHCDVLVVGGGAAGLAAARVAGAAGARVILCEQDFSLGGGLLAEHPHEQWRQQTLAALSAMPEVTLLSRTTVFGYYDCNVLGAVRTCRRPPARAATTHAASARLDHSRALGRAGDRRARALHRFPGQRPAGRHADRRGSDLCNSVRHARGAPRAALCQQRCRV